MKSKHTLDVGERLNRRWQDILADSIATAEELSAYLDVDIRAINEVVRYYPMRINPYYLSLIKKWQGPIWKQSIPDIKEIADTPYQADPLAEESLSPVSSIIHRYPDRALFRVSNHCALYCRFCLRKRTVGGEASISEASIGDGLAYLRQNRHIHEVILSGGDPLVLDNDRIEYILNRIRSISHIDIIRIHTRIPCTLPVRIDFRLTEILKKFHPLFINTHFNHPDEITPESTAACMNLADAGIPLGCQTVLLKGINDNPLIMHQLMKKLVTMRVKPYYIHHADPVKGTGHFRTSIETGLSIMRSLRGNISGMCVPQYVIDLPGGAGKVPLLPEYRRDATAEAMVVENYQGQLSSYPLK